MKTTLTTRLAALALAGALALGLTGCGAGSSAHRRRSSCSVSARATGCPPPANSSAGVTSYSLHISFINWVKWGRSLSRSACDWPVPRGPQAAR